MRNHLIVPLKLHFSSHVGIEVEYVKHAIDLLLECLYKLVDSLLQTAEGIVALLDLIMDRRGKILNFYVPSDS